MVMAIPRYYNIQGIPRREETTALPQRPSMKNQMKLVNEIQGRGIKRKMANKMAHISRRSKGWKDWALFADHVTPEQLSDINIRKLNIEGLRRKDKATAIATAIAQNQLAMERAQKRKKPDMTIADFEEEGAGEVIENDQDWINYEEQVKNARRKELSTQTFWIKQHKETLQRVYQQVFPGIQQVPDGTSTTKKAYLDAIKDYLKQDAAAEKIIIGAAIGLEKTQTLRHQKGRMQSKVSLQVLVLPRFMNTIKFSLDSRHQQQRMQYTSSCSTRKLVPQKSHG
eukprot:scaffold6352_cov85-Cylindrotheca_fusiformis.AAC.1